MVFGSSPLARGLLSKRHRKGPRNGSSPLARGLRAFGRGGFAIRGIIPARAGFTLPILKCDQTLSDHPRSRGVYDPAAHAPQPRPGSSPLARGLQWAADLRVVGDRIIPARAGFTSASPSPISPIGDHPRSRGVYTVIGLLGVATDGIIPARAGFTTLAVRALYSARDHPRSRGVYATPSSGSLLRRGSSPLARGLLEKVRAAVSDVRIIPARAGFTAGSAPP